MYDFRLFSARVLLVALGFLLLPATLQAETTPPASAASGFYPLPEKEEHLVGHPRTTVASEDDTLVLIGRRYRTGYGAIRAANPLVDSWMPREGTEVLLPTWHILPEAPRQGIVINTAEMRLYHFEAASGDHPARVGVYAISIGRDGRETPLAGARVTRKAENPTWYPTETIREERAQRGEPVPAVVPPGPANPLGTRALYLNLPTYLIHGTNRELGIGMPVTAGCVRMYPEDIEYLYEQVPVGSKVEIVHQPVKAGWSGDVLYVESHDPLQELQLTQEERLQQLRAAIARTVSDRADFTVDWDKVREAVLESTGVPVPVGPIWLVDEALGQVDDAATPAG
ncbi:L,D-transpeptidase family protein [Haliea sp. E1-2-M8]|uniref:L,D-transpeptidase family protein n=1 Tax=Haliea sp. E1-2-M8 TaxID=3064706 RepID=UPI0027279DD5|nr:L,D-transpeptidase family protein [Haliea sp. E1-2-M8]MDO8862856.1 L,D-transpeptidase family protein [Haliea sp. E1-2-M8]